MALGLRLAEHLRGTSYRGVRLVGVRVENLVPRARVHRQGVLGVEHVRGLRLAPLLDVVAVQEPAPVHDVAGVGDDPAANLPVIAEDGTIYSSAVKEHYHYSASSTALDLTLHEFRLGGAGVQREEHIALLDGLTHADVHRVDDARQRGRDGQQLTGRLHEAGACNELFGGRRRGRRVGVRVARILAGQQGLAPEDLAQAALARLARIAGLVGAGGHQRRAAHDQRHAVFGAGGAVLALVRHVGVGAG